jgi:hypothetical protein
MMEAFRLLRTHSYEDAVRAFKKVLGRERTSTRAYLGIAFLQLRDDPTGVGYLESFIEAAPKDPLSLLARKYIADPLSAEAPEEVREPALHPHQRQRR